MPIRLSQATKGKLVTGISQIAETVEAATEALIAARREEVKRRERAQMIVLGAVRIEILADLAAVNEALPIHGKRLALLAAGTSHRAIAAGIQSISTT